VKLRVYLEYACATRCTHIATTRCTHIATAAAASATAIAKENAD
jgi:hypothetical protein